VRRLAPPAGVNRDETIESETEDISSEDEESEMDTARAAVE
jgi:hypothetical protein